MVTQLALRDICYLGLFLTLIGCNKLVQVPNPTSSVTSDQAFSSDATATSAILGIYSHMSGNQSFTSYATTFYLGRSADELTDERPGNEHRDNVMVNNLTALQNSSNFSQMFWQPAYFDIYSANAILAGIQASTGLTTATRNQLTGEAKFIRAFCYFYLTNIYGNVPLVLTPDFTQTSLLANALQSKIYDQIINDLTDAQQLMISDFSLSNEMPIRANKWAATGLLARVYAYQAKWQSADSAATAVINSGNFQLVNDLNSVFLANSVEAILQLQTLNIYPYATIEAGYFIPSCPTCGPGSAWLTADLLSAFEPNDLRRANWVDSSTSGLTQYYYPYKYKSSPFTSASSGNITENYTLLRFAEQYLIRAEAEVNLNQTTAAINDVDVIRARAGLDSLSSSLTPAQVQAAIQQEYRIEFFSEWGHRWLDLKRWGIAIQTLDGIPYKAPYIDSTQLLYPIPISEIQTDPNLVQNPGYTN